MGSLLAEQETTIRWDREDQTVDIWTADTLFHARMTKYGWNPIKTGKT